MIRRSVVMPVDPETLWEALTDPDALAGWFGGHFVEWSPREGAPLRWADDDGSERRGEVESVRSARHLRFSWWPVDEPGDASEVSYLLESEPGEEACTRLTVQERRASQERRVGPRQVGNLEAGATWTGWDSRLARAWARASAEPVARC